MRRDPRRARTPRPPVLARPGPPPGGAPRTGLPSSGLPGSALPRPGLLSTRLASTRTISTRWISTRLVRMTLVRGTPILFTLVMAGLLLTGGLLAAGCSATQAPFRPAGVTAPGGTASPAGPAQGTAGTLRWPPFGGNVRIFMPGWLPAVHAEAPAVITAKNFLLAFLYAEYRGNQDDRWTRYVSGDVLSALQANLSQPSVTTESFTGTILFSHMRAYPDPAVAGAIDVSECFDNSGSDNTELATGKVAKDRVPASQHYYRNTDVMARKNGQWNVISVYPVVYYPQAGECRP